MARTQSSSSSRASRTRNSAVVCPPGFTISQYGERVRRPSQARTTAAVAPTARNRMKRRYQAGRAGKSVLAEATESEPYSWDPSHLRAARTGDRRRDRRRNRSARNVRFRAGPTQSRRATVGKPTRSKPRHVLRARLRQARSLAFSPSRGPIFTRGAGQSAILPILLGFRAPRKARDRQ
jgi:hypothetical protein